MINFKGDNNMNILTKSIDKHIDRMFIIDKNKSEYFLEDMKKNKIKPEFLNECLDYYNLMKGK